MRRLFVSLVLTMLSTHQVMAWGEQGHSIVAEIAQRRLADNAASMVQKLLGQAGSPGYSTPSLASVSAWADDVRYTTHRFSEPWHYVNAPLSGSIAIDRDCAAPRGCVVSALQSLRNELRCGADDGKKADALRFAVHFVGDIHQPFHTVLEGQGANQVHVNIEFGGKICDGRTCLLKESRENLHTVWDTTLITKTFYNWGAYVSYLEDGWLKSMEAQADVVDDPLSWADGAHLLAKDSLCRMVRRSNVHTMCGPSQ